MPRWWIDLRRTALLSWNAAGFLVGLLIGRTTGRATAAILLRQALQRMGMTYLKLGQYLALRLDLLPSDVTRELSKLFEAAEPMPPGDVRRVIESELGGRLELVFARFEWSPVASASIAQVHEAVTSEGERVAVKVQRPDLEAAFEADMRGLTLAARTMDRLGLMGELSLREAVEEFATYTRRELDFQLEALTANRLRREAAFEEIVPRIVWGLSTRRVLTMEYIEGVSVGRVIEALSTGREAELTAAVPELDLRLASHNLARASLHQMFGVGFFHADPHPGNLLLCRGNRVAYLDFGIFGQLSPEQREIMASYIEHLVIGDVEEAFRHYQRLLTPTAHTDLAAFKRESQDVQSRWYETSRHPAGAITHRLVAPFADEMLTVVRRHRMRMNMDTLLFWRAMIVLDATLLQLCRDFDLLAEVGAYFRLTRPTLAERLVDTLRDSDALASLGQLASRGPRVLRDALADAAAGQLQVHATLRPSLHARRAERRRVECVTLGLLGLSLIVAAGAFGVAAATALSSAAAVLFFVSLYRLRR